MDIAYVRTESRSRFLRACEAAIRRHRAGLDSGGVVNVELGDAGYVGHVVVKIRPHDRAFFGTDWERKDATRFPARIKAAATALRNCGCEGRFRIIHSDGSLAIRGA